MSLLAHDLFSGKFLAIKHPQFRVQCVTTESCSNIIHYRSLLHAKQEAHKQFKATAALAAITNRRHFPGSSPEEHELLTFDLMESPLMRKARYKVKIVHYGALMVYIALFYHFLPELHWDEFTPGVGTVEGLVVGLLSGLVTVLLNENKLCDMRTAWRPAADFESRELGLFWDVIRTVGAFTTPYEDCLFYHSWMYRLLVQYLRVDEDMPIRAFTEVSFTSWSWRAWLACNSAFALYNGKEWRSSLVSGLLSLWAMGRKGQFLDGIIALTACRMTVNTWVLLTGQRQFW
ncbi:hypothetical protein R1sor_019226 [Riccia sorocarpa]|uniref:Uncharacterized protein n=1 Tax=Riccia sorocarpa TaxID=122646 RepID=A0ABD3IF82_9MARC